MIFQFFLPHSFIIFLSREELHDQAFSFHRCVVLFHCTEGERSGGIERWDEKRKWREAQQKSKRYITAPSVAAGPVCMEMHAEQQLSLFVCEMCVRCKALTSL